MRIAKTFLVLGAFLAVTGCEKKDQVAKPETVVGVDPAREATASGITVKLLEPGAEPRQALRYDFSKVKKQKVEMIMDMAMDVEIGPVHQSPKIPPIRMEIQVTPKKVSGTGDLRYEFELTDAAVIDAGSADPEVAKVMEAELAKTKGLSGWAEVSARGFTKKADVNIPPGATPQLRDLVGKMKSQIEQMSAPLPEEPVGIGARWEVTQPISNEMLELNQVAIYTLKEFKDGVATMDISLKQTAQSQDIGSGMPAATARLTSLESSGSGTSQVDLEQLVPRADVQISTTMTVDIRAQGQQQTMKTKIDIKMKIRPE